MVQTSLSESDDDEDEDEDEEEEEEEEAVEEEDEEDESDEPRRQRAAAAASCSDMGWLRGEGGDLPTASPLLRCYVCVHWYPVLLEAGGKKKEGDLFDTLAKLLLSDYCLAENFAKPSQPDRSN